MPPRGRKEADTCRDFVLPALINESGWKPHQIQEQVRITDGQILGRGRKHERAKPLRADYVLEISPGFPVGALEAKREHKRPEDGLEQAKEYAERLDLPVAIATNGHGIVAFDFRTGTQQRLDAFPRPDELWERYRSWHGLHDDVAALLREPFNRDLRNTDGSAKEPRYYQRIAIHKTIAAILGDRKRLLLTMATGTGKTFTAMQIVWKLWRYWETRGESGTRRILYLVDRDALVDQALQDVFRPVFKNSANRILGKSSTAYSIYFATYQALRRGIGADRFREFPQDYFDLIVVDECHRGSATEESTWREILEYFHSATQLGLTATPKRDSNVDTYANFGNPIYSYSLQQGIKDGFLAPYRVQRVVLSPDAHGWSPDPGQLDRFGREIPDRLYETKDFERVVSLLLRTDAAARYLTDHLRANPMAKTVVFCVDDDHANEMRNALVHANRQLMVEHSDYVVRITHSEGDVGVRRLERFKDVNSQTPVIVTTVRMLATGVDIPTLQTIVLFKPIRSIVEFKQVIGRGTRLEPYLDKLWFEIVDFTGATSLFEDPEFDGVPELVTNVTLDDTGAAVEQPQAQEPEPPFGLPADVGVGPPGGDQQPTPPPNAPKFVVDDGDEVYVAAEGVYLTDARSNRLELVEYRDYTAGIVRRLFPTPTRLRDRWQTAPTRKVLAKELARRGIDLEELADRTGLSDSDPFDILVHLAWNEPVLTRYDRVRKVRREHAEFFDRFQSKACEVLDRLLERYAVHGVDDLSDFAVLRLEPISELGTVKQIIDEFGTGERLRNAVQELQRLLYAA